MPQEKKYMLYVENDPETPYTTVIGCQFIGPPEQVHIEIVPGAVNITGLILIPAERGIRFMDWIDSKYPKLAHHFGRIKRIQDTH